MGNLNVAGGDILFYIGRPSASAESMHACILAMHVHGIPY